MADGATESGANERTSSLRERSTREVFEDHLRLRTLGRFDEDVERNYSPDVVILHSNGVVHGHAGLRKSGRRLASQMPGAEFSFEARHVYGPYAYLEWSGTSDHHRVSDGADAFVIENGEIVMQSIHYTLLDGSSE